MKTLSAILLLMLLLSAGAVAIHPESAQRRNMDGVTSLSVIYINRPRATEAVIKREYGQDLPPVVGYDPAAPWRHPPQVRGRVNIAANYP